MAKQGRPSKQESRKADPRSTSPNARQGETVAGYFRAIFQENPKLLKERSNEQILQRWLADHPGEREVPNRVKVGLQNVKSVLRSKRRRKAVRRAAQAPVQPAAPAEAPVNAITQGLEALEAQIDDCLMAARNLDPKGLQRVIEHLRWARNTVVWKLGE